METKQQLHIKTAFFFENCNTTNLSSWCTACSPTSLPAELHCFIDLFFISVHNTARHNTAEETSTSCNVENSFHRSLLQFVSVMQQQRLISQKKSAFVESHYNSLTLGYGFGYHVFSVLIQWLVSKQQWYVSRLKFHSKSAISPTVQNTGQKWTCKAYSFEERITQEILYCVQGYSSGDIFLPKTCLKKTTSPSSETVKVQNIKNICQIFYP